MKQKIVMFIIVFLFMYLDWYMRKDDDNDPYGQH